MIISDSKSFVFIHIPKCAGTTVRNALYKYDDTNGAFTSRVEEHPVLGMLDYVHVTLDNLRRYFPVQFSKLRCYRSFSVIRDPFARFPSSLAQWVRVTKREVLMELDTERQLTHARKVIELLEKAPKNLDHCLIHFQKQVDYLFLDGKLIVDLIVVIHELDMREAEIGEYLGVPDLIFRTQNRSLHYRNQVIKYAVENGKHVLSIPWHFLPMWAKRPIHRLVFTQRNISETETQACADVFSHPEIRNFIASYYADDIALYDSYKKSS